MHFHRSGLKVDRHKLAIALRAYKIRAEKLTTHTMIFLRFSWDCHSFLAHLNESQFIHDNVKLWSVARNEEGKTLQRFPRSWLDSEKSTTIRLTGRNDLMGIVLMLACWAPLFQRDLHFFFFVAFALHNLFSTIFGEMRMNSFAWWSWLIYWRDAMTSRDSFVHRYSRCRCIFLWWSLVRRENVYWRSTSSANY